MELQGDEALLSKFREGDRETLADVYRHFRIPVERMLRKGFTFSSRGKTIRFQGYRRPFELQEAMQDAFIHAFREKARQGFDGQRPYQPYLLSIVRNLVIDRYRKAATEQKFFVALGDVSAPEESEQDAMDRVSTKSRSPSLDPETQTMQKELKELLGGFLEGLDDIDRAIVQQHLLGELTQQQMADELGTDRNGLRKRIKEMRLNLLRYLKTNGFIETLQPKEALHNAASMGMVMVPIHMLLFHALICVER